MRQYTLGRSFALIGISRLALDDLGSSHLLVVGVLLSANSPMGDAQRFFGRSQHSLWFFFICELTRTNPHS
jgi:hypothetical protein